MSLINQMLQDLDERRTDGLGGAAIHSGIRAVPDNRMHPAWWIAGMLAVALIGVGILLWWYQTTLKTNQRVLAEQQAQLSLKLAANFNGASSERPRNAGGEVAAASAGKADKQVKSVKAEQSTDMVHAAAAAEDHRSSLSSLKSSSSAMGGSTLQAPASAPGAAKNSEVKSSASAAVSADKPVPSNAIKQVNELSPQQRAENEYRKAASLMQQSKSAEATAALEQALMLDPQHAAARQTLVGLLLEGRRTDEAIRIAQEGLNADAGQVGLAMILARLQVDKGQLQPAVETLQQSLPYAVERADYQAFLGALLQRAGRHRDAIARYLVAVSRAPQNAVWWMGLGISLQAENRINEAQEAFGHAKEAGTLSPELQAFVEQRLSQLQH